MRRLSHHLGCEGYKHLLEMVDIIDLIDLFHGKSAKMLDTPHFLIVIVMTSVYNIAISIDGRLKPSRFGFAGVPRAAASPRGRVGCVEPRGK